MSTIVPVWKAQGGPLSSLSSSPSPDNHAARHRLQRAFREITSFFPFRTRCPRPFYMLCSLRSTFRCLWHTANPPGGANVQMSRAGTRSRGPTSRAQCSPEQHKCLSRASGRPRGHMRQASFTCFSVLFALALGNKATGFLVPIPTACHCLSLC